MVRPSQSQALSCGFHDVTRDGVQGIDLHEACDLREEPMEQAEVAPGYADNRRAGFLIRDTFLRQRDPRGDPLALEQLPHLRRTEGTKRMHKAYP